MDFIYSPALSDLDTKQMLVEVLGMSRDALHFHVSLALFFGALLIFKRRLGDWLPLALVLFVAVAGEVWDVRSLILRDIPIDPLQNAHDIVLTLAWPVLLTVYGRWKRAREPEGPA